MGYPSNIMAILLRGFVKNTKDPQFLMGKTYDLTLKTLCKLTDNCACPAQIRGSTSFLEP